MKKCNLAKIVEFQYYRNVALVGISRDPKKFGHQLAMMMIANGYNLVPVHPEAKEMLGLNCVQSVDKLPEDTQAIVIATTKANTDQILKFAIRAGIRQVWVQQFSETPETITTALTPMQTSFWADAYLCIKIRRVSI